MKSIARDIATITISALFFYYIAELSTPSIKQFTDGQPERLLYLAVIASCAIVFSYASIASFIQKIAKTYRTVGYHSILSINLLIGFIASYTAMRIAAYDSEIYYTSELLLVFMLFLGSAILLDINLALKEKDNGHLTTQDMDLLNRTIFIEKVISLLQNTDKLVSKSKDEALVIWIASTWGTGKSWILEKIRTQYAQEKKTETTIWFSFNPWLHSTANPEMALVQTFFEQLLDEVNKRFFIEGLNKSISDYTKSILSQSTQRVFNIDISPFLPAQQTTEDLKKEISEFLVEARIRLIITFDEIDRLTPTELVTCLKLIRSLANFSSTVILICGAPDKMEYLLKHAGLPPDYLEKISHVPLSLPLVGVNKILDILWMRINGDSLPQIEKETLAKAFDHLRSNIFHSYDQTSLLNNLRVIERLADSITLDFLAQDKSEDLNCFDFINLQLVRLNCFPLYEVIKNNKSLWIGEKGSLKEEALKKRKVALEEIISTPLTESNTKKVALQKILQQMFPVFKEGIEAYHYIGSQDDRNSIRNADAFDRYFVEGLPEGQVSNKKISTLIEEWDKKTPVSTTLADLSTADIAWVFRELTTTKPDRLNDATKILLVKFLIDQKLDQNIEYIAYSYRADPEDFTLSSKEPYLEILAYYLSKSTNIDAKFFAACDYINHVYWKKQRYGLEQLTRADIKELLDLARNAFRARTLDQSLDILTLEDAKLHYYWCVLSRDDANFENELRNSIIKRITEDPDAFCRYLYVFREAARNAREGFRNNYDRQQGFTRDNIDIAKAHLTNPSLSEAHRKEIETFIGIAEENTYEAQLQN